STGPTVGVLTSSTGSSALDLLKDPLNSREGMLPGAGDARVRPSMLQPQSRPLRNRRQRPGHDCERARRGLAPGEAEAKRRRAHPPRAPGGVPGVERDRGAEWRLEVMGGGPRGREAAVGERAPDALARIGIDHSQDPDVPNPPPTSPPGAASRSRQNRS